VFLSAPLEGTYEDDEIKHRHVHLSVDPRARVAEITVTGPSADEPVDAAGMRQRGADLWALRAFRELDDVLLDLRFNRPDVGVVVLKTRGTPASVLRVDEALVTAQDDWFVAEVVHYMKSVLRRLDLTARSLIALIDTGSCFAGSLMELALAADRSYMLDAEDGPTVALGRLNQGSLPTWTGMSRLAQRFLGEPERAEQAVGEILDARSALKAGLVTFAPDDIDWEDEVRLAIEERASLSPDASREWRRACDSPAPRPWRRRSSGACPPGRTGSFSARTRWASEVL
jgi:benzoyl-CoA-dihydrodiol lyase